MFGTKKLHQAVEELEVERRELVSRLAQMSWRLFELERDSSDIRTWNNKVRAKNSALRRERRRLRELLELNNITWLAASPNQGRQTDA